MPRPPANPALAASFPPSPASRSTPFTATTRSIAAVTARFSPQVESMEGAGFMYACLIRARAVRPGPRRLEHRRAAESRRLEDGRGHRQPRPHRARHPRSRMKLSLGFSPCPNDCFMFDAIVNRRIDLEGLDVYGAHGGRRGAEQGGVRRRRRRHQAELSRLRVLRRPLRAARRRQRAREELRTAADLEARRSRRRRSLPGNLQIAIPGKYTTANFLLGLAFPAARDRRPSSCSRRSSRRCSTIGSMPA